MALLLENGNYVKVQGLENNQIVISKYKDEEMRKREKTIGLGEFEHVVFSVKGFPIEYKKNYEVDSDKNLSDNEITMLYTYLKTLSEYENSTDV